MDQFDVISTYHFGIAAEIDERWYKLTGNDNCFILWSLHIVCFFGESLRATGNWSLAKRTVLKDVIPILDFICNKRGHQYTESFPNTILSFTYCCLKGLSEKV